MYYWLPDGGPRNKYAAVRADAARPGRAVRDSIAPRSRSVCRSRRRPASTAGRGCSRFNGPDRAHRHHRIRRRRAGARLLLFVRRRLPRDRRSSIRSRRRPSAPPSRAAAATFCGDEDRFWPDLDAVVVCTPDATHATYVVKALERGLHVLVEKPLTDSVEGLCAIRRAAAAAPSQVVAVVHQMRFVPLHQRIKALAADGSLGALSYLEGYYVHDLTTRAFQNDRWRDDGQRDAARVLRVPLRRPAALVRRRRDRRGVCGGQPSSRFRTIPKSDLNVVTMQVRLRRDRQGGRRLRRGGPQDHTVRVAGSAATVRNNLLYRRDGRLGEVLHRPMVFQPPLLAGPGKTGGQSRYRQLRTNLPPYVFARTVEALRVLARRPNAEYGAAQYPVRLYEHSLACVEAIERLRRRRFAIAAARCVRSTKPAGPCWPVWPASSRTGRIVPSRCAARSSNHDARVLHAVDAVPAAERDVRLHAW